MNLKDLVEVDPEKMSGAPVFAGTRGINHLSIISELAISSMYFLKTFPPLHVNRPWVYWSGCRTAFSSNMKLLLDSGRSYGRMSTVEEIVNAVKGLSLHQQAEVRRRLDTLPARPDENGVPLDDSHQAAMDVDQRVQQALFEAGLVSEIKPPITDPTPLSP
jgi:hypothetical protein